MTSPNSNNSVKERVLNPMEFTVSDIIDIALLLQKDPVEVFESILNDLAYTGLIHQCEQFADDILESGNKALLVNSKQIVQ